MRSGGTNPNLKCRKHTTTREKTNYRGEEKRRETTRRRG
jgi:hypothetical protein